MGGMRITQGFMVDRTLNSLNRQLNELAILQEQLATGQRVNRPSDDPLDARRAISIRTSIRQNEQFVANIQDVSPHLRATESAVNSVQSILQRVLELTVQAANETVNLEQTQQIALEIDELLEQIVLESNQETNDRAIFGGTRTSTDPFIATRVGDTITSVAYVGNNGDIEIPFSKAGRATINVPGDEVFLGDIDIFQLLIDIRDDMNVGDQNSLSQVRLAEINTGLNQMLNNLAKVGTFQNRLERVGDSAEDLILEFQAQLSDKIDADFAETITRFNVQQNSFQAALNASARVIQVSLLDFIR
ncbi:MAG: flagellar hook-associated protein 3 [Candidatus Hydrogenedentota bacterium]|nr:MAG: flagellar hook-associated protein 3 [Candidatus Hydrogenedentota bacterium]